MTAVTPIDESTTDEMEVHRQDVAQHPPQDDRWPDRFAGAALIFAAFVFVVALVPPWHHYFAQTNDLVSLLLIPIVPSLVYAALLLVMAEALRRRLRTAWWIMVIWWLALPEIGRVIDIVDGDDVALNAIGFVLVAAVIVLAVRTRPQFAARRVPGSLRGAIAVFLVGGAVVLLGGAWLVTEFGTSADYGRSVEFVWNAMVSDLGRGGSATSLDDGATTAPFWVRLVIGLVGAVVVLGAATMLFRASKDSRTLDVADDAKVRALLRDFGEHDSLGYFATRRDKSVVWDTGDVTTARAGVSYRTIGSVCLASGNPVGDPDLLGRCTRAVAAARPRPTAGRSR